MSDFDVVIAGGGLSGLCLARQVRRSCPDASVAVIDPARGPLPEAAHKVGESSVELGSHYLEEALGLVDYLGERHLRKNGLSFYVGGGDGPLHARTEICPPELPTVPSYQLDRGRLENDLRRMLAEDDGAELLEGARVTDVTVGAPHEVVTDTGATLRARWLIDATGRRRLLARKLGLTRQNAHEAHAAWFRLDTKLTIDDLVPRSETDWHQKDQDKIRWRSTSHLMGEGYWVWIIPLPSGKTSIGAVVHGDVHAFDDIRTLDKLKGWLAAHEVTLSDALEGLEVLDFGCLKDYSHTCAQSFSADRWALVGEAGLFVDPLYSPGTDFIALANAHAGELIRRDLAGEDIRARVDFVDPFFRRLGDTAVGTYTGAAKIYGQPRVMASKIYFDTFIYWAFLCEYYFQRVWAEELDVQRSFLPVSERYADVNARAQRLFRAWAERVDDPTDGRYITLPVIPSQLVRLHLDLEERRTPDEALARMDAHADVAEELLTDLLLRALTETGDPSLLDALDAREWPLSGLEARVRAEIGPRKRRRRRLSAIAREVERCLGPTEGDLLAAATDAFGPEITAAAE